MPRLETGVRPHFTRFGPKPDIQRAHHRSGGGAHVRGDAPLSSIDKRAGGLGVASIVELKKELLEKNFVIVPFVSLTEGLRPELAQLRESFGRLPQDPFFLSEDMVDGKPPRQRRYAEFKWDPTTDDLSKLPHVPYRPNPTLVIDQYRPDMEERLFDPIEDAVAQNPILQRFILTVASLLPSDLRVPSRVLVQQFRINAPEGGESAKVTPEGSHQDGTDAAATLVMDKYNVEGGEVTVEDLDRTPLASFTPGILEGYAFFDQRIRHRVSPILSRDGSQGHRDVFIIAFDSLESLRQGGLPY
jgi:hypothetical protein